MNLPIMPGDVVLVESKTFFARLIKSFGRSRWSHTAIGAHINGMIFEANLLVCLTDWKYTRDNPNLKWRVYRWRAKRDRDSGLLSAITVFDKYNEKTYGFFQLLWFVWRYVVEGLHLPKRFARKNFFPNGEICTEVVFRFLEECRGYETTPLIRDALRQLDREGDTVNPADIETVMETLRRWGVVEIAGENL